jgi:hypothetical protein
LQQRQAAVRRRRLQLVAQARREQQCEAALEYIDARIRSRELRDDVA